MSGSTMTMTMTRTSTSMGASMDTRAERVTDNVDAAANAGDGRVAECFPKPAQTTRDALPPPPSHLTPHPSPLTPPATRLRRHRLALAICCIGVAAMATVAPAQPAGKQSRVATGLSSAVAIEWERDGLRDALMELARQQEVVIFLDRRIDPDRHIEFSQTRSMTLGLLLGKLAESLDAAIIPIGDVLYMAPVESAGRLAGRLKRLEQSCSRAWPELRGRTMRLEWNEGARPRELLRQVARQLGLVVDNLDDLPHDVWPAYRLPPLGPPQLLTLLTAGFGKTVEPSTGRRLTIEPLDGDGIQPRWYYHRPRQAVSLKELGQRFPGVEWKREGRWLVAEGPRSELRGVLGWLVQRDGSRDGSGEPLAAHRYTLAVQQQPLGAVLKTLQTQGWKLRLDPSARRQLAKRISFQVKRATIEELLKAALNPVGLQFRVQGDTIVIGSDADG